jgi:hypothetical protein
VDYRTGISAGTSLTPWTSYRHAGFSVDTKKNYWIRCDNTNNVTLNGIDFSTSNGAILYLNNCSNITVQNSKWSGGSNIAGSSYWIASSGASCGLSLLNDDIDGGGTAAVFSHNCGTITVEYNYFRHFSQHVGEFAIRCPSDTTIVYKYNVIGDGSITAGAHENYQQVGCGTINSDVEFNTSEQVSTGGAEGWQFYCVGHCTMHSPTLAHNTMVALNSRTMSYIAHGSAGHASTTPTGTANVIANYCDPTGAYGCFYPNSFKGWMASGNKNMVTGGAITP